ncbi:MAG TPA: ABC transporter ATP-binding protein [Syntrophobacteria bacterium]|nr:ABC transporter ATP-binding protein [Syntrophobacteria bacterium]
MPLDVVLEVKGVTKRFGGLIALDNVSLRVRGGTIQGIIGPNGSGKTTLFNVLSGILQPEAGRVTFKGQDITKLPPYQRSRAGIARTFQQARLFTSLTVRENILASYLERQSLNLGSRMWKRSSGQKGYADEVIAFFGLQSFQETACASLPYGVQKLTEIARAMASKPDLLLLDEPVNGMNAEEVKGVCDLLRRIKDELKVAILLIEHNMSLVMSECEVVNVLSSGLNLAEGSPRVITTNEQVIEAYLGKRVGISLSSSSKS